MSIPLRGIDAKRSMEDVIKLNDTQVKEIAGHYKLPMTQNASKNKSVLIEFLLSKGWNKPTPEPKQVQADDSDSVKSWSVGSM